MICAHTIGGIPPLGAKTIDNGHGRIELRSIRTTTRLNGYIDFPHVAQAWMIEREVFDTTGTRSMERVYGITSQSPEQATADTLLHQVCNHWGIENRSHWVRDVTFREDRSSIRTGSAPRTMAAIRNFVIGLLRLLGFTQIAKARRAFAANARRTLNLLNL